MPKLTENQKRILSEMPDDEYKFPGPLEAQSYRKLESLGYVTSELMLAKRDNVKGESEFRLAYMRTQKGKDLCNV